MRTLFLALALFATAAHAEVGVSITVGEPGFYGRIDIGDAPRPRLLFPEPVIVRTVTVVREPVYLRVPPGHAKDWGKHCHKYDACERRVYFVDDDWYEREYVPHYHHKVKLKGGNGGKGHGGHKGDKGHSGKGHGKGNGKGNGKGKD